MPESGFVEVPGGRLYYEVEGSGKPLLLIHGGLGSLRMWDAQVPEFAERHRVVRFDTRGYGRSETEHVEFSNRADAVAVLAHVGAATCDLVGQSRGGVIALDLALERPDLVEALVVAAGGASGLEPDLPEGTLLPPWEEMERLWESKAWDQLAEMETRVWVDGWGRPSTRVAPALRARVRDWILENYRAAKEEGIAQPLDPPAARRLADVTQPTLVIVGSLDEPGTVANGRTIGATIPGARLVEFEDAAHMVHLEDPGRFTRTVLDFLADAVATDAERAG
jgi:pimeloyl-ACP methyl ester carboxylesterase